MAYGIVGVVFISLVSALVLISRMGNGDDEMSCKYHESAGYARSSNQPLMMS